MVDPVSAAAAAKYVYGAFSTLSQGLSKKDKRALQASGATTAVRGLQIDGQRVTQRQAIRAGRAVLAAQAAGAPSPVPRPLPTGGDLLSDLLNRPHRPGGSVRVPSSVPDFERILNQPQQPYRPPPPTELEQLLRRSPAAVRAARLAYALARGTSLIGGIFYPSRTADSDLGYRAPPRPAPPSEPPPPSKGPKTRPRTPGRPLKDPRFRFEPFPESVADRLPPRTPQPEARIAPLPRTPVLSAPLPAPIGSPRTVSTPRTVRGTQPAPRPYPRATAIPAPNTLSLPSPLSVLPFMLPRPSQQPAPRIANPLQASTEPAYRPGISDRPLTAPLPRPLAFAPPMSQDPCTCRSTSSKPKRKRKERTVCYRGTFTESRRSTSKIRKEKIPCQ